MIMMVALLMNDDGDGDADEPFFSAPQNLASIKERATRLSEAERSSATDLSHLELDSRRLARRAGAHATLHRG